MASIKISELNELEEASKQDLLVIVDVANNETKKIKAKNFAGGTTIPVSDTPPEDPEDGALWVDTDDEGVIVEVDQEVNSGSTNAVSNSAITNYVNGLNTYSTEEKVVGKWIDGKPIYRKVLYIPNVVGNQVIDINVPNLEALFICEDKSYIYVQEYGNRIPLNFNASGEIWSATYSQGTKIKTSFGEAYKDKTLYIIITIEYTKTTDVPTSEEV